MTLLVGIALGGCIPYRYADGPGFRGTIVSGLQNAPVVGARVTLSYGKGRLIETRHVETTSDAAGSFSFPSKRIWGVYVVPMDPYGIFGNIEIFAVGFSPKNIAVMTGAMGPAETNLGMILLDESR